MKTIYYIPALVAGMLSLASCNDNEPSSGGNSPAEAQSGINFNIGLEEASSRTEYSTADWLQIEWVAGQNPDLITIFCANTKHPKLTADKSDNRYYTDANWEGKDNAVYKVSSVIPYTHDVTLSDGTTQSVTTNSKAHITVNSTDPKDALYWNTVNEYYTFYAGYGEHFGMEFKNNAYTGVAVCRYTADQELTQGKDGTWINMSQAYMFATKTTQAVDNVDLHFKPIMTTVEIDVKAPSDGTSITVKALEIKIPASQDKLYLGTGTSSTQCYANFDYNIKTGECPTVTTHATDEKFIFTLATPQTISGTGTVKIAAILPPILINEANPITITVDANEGSNTAAFNQITATTKVVNQGEKVVIKANAWRVKPQAPTFVDLGLPSGTQWASCNLEATTPKEYGDYFGWGCTIPYASSAIPNWPLYFKKIGGTGTEKGHCGSTSTGVDPLASYVNGNNKRISGTSYDPAYVRLAGQAYMPSEEQWEELRTGCNWFPYNADGSEKTGQSKNTPPVAYYKVVNKSDNSKFIILPSGGGLDEKNHSGEGEGGKQGYYKLGSRGYFWTSSNYQSSSPSEVHDFVSPQDPVNSNPYAPGVGQYARFHGRPIRPVNKIYPDNNN